MTKTTAILDEVPFLVADWFDRLEAVVRPEGRRLHMVLLLQSVSWLLTGYMRAQVPSSRKRRKYQ